MATRFYRRRRAGIWDQVLADLQQRVDATGKLDWSLHHVDGTTLRAHQHAPGAQKGGSTTLARVPDEALGRSQGGFGTKIHIRAEGGGKSMALLLTAGQRHEQVMFDSLMEAGAVKRPGHGRPRIRPDRVAMDKGYSSKKVRRNLRRRSIGVVIARQKREWRVRFDKDASRKRSVVERLINRVKQFRQIATHYEQQAVNYLAMLTSAAITLWL